MEEHLDNYADKCRCCLEEITLAKVEIDSIIDMKFYQMTQLNLVASNLLPSYICYDCYEILTNYSNYRSKFIENQQKLEQMFLDNENVVTEEGDVIEYEEIEMADDHEAEFVIEHISDPNEISQEESETEDELKLEDIVKPEFLHYCLPKKEEPEPVIRVFQIPKQLEKKRHKIEEILREQVKQESKYLCHECGKNFKSSASLQEHVSSIHQKSICEFEECSKIFSSQNQLNKHVSTFHKKSLHECKFCNKKFSMKLHLKNHLYIHTQ